MGVCTGEKAANYASKNLWMSNMPRDEPYAFLKKIAEQINIGFRKDILHNGVVDYADEELKSTYGILSDFIDALVILKHWITVKNVADGHVE